MVGERHTDSRRNATCRSNARHDLKGNARRRERLRLFATATEHEGIAPFESRDTKAAPSQLDE